MLLLILRTSIQLPTKCLQSHDWTALVNNSYAVITNLSANTLGSSSSDGLPPDWIEMNRQSGAFTANASANLDTNFGYDAFRIPFNLALDYTWYHDPRDQQTLSKFSYLKTLWQKNHSLDAVYAHDGSVVGNYQAPAMYGATIGYFIVEDPSDAKSVYQNKLQTLYSPDKQTWKTSLSYYDDNWAWFGLALTQGALPNLTTHT
jgi:endo-1,4-beta-D-glucanase Y